MVCRDLSEQYIVQTCNERDYGGRIVDGVTVGCRVRNRYKSNQSNAAAIYHLPWLSGFPSDVILDPKLNLTLNVELKLMRSV